MTGRVTLMLRALCSLRWLNNFIKSSLEITRAMEATFALKEGPWPLDFIIKDLVKTFRWL